MPAHRATRKIVPRTGRRAPGTAARSRSIRLSRRAKGSRVDTQRFMWAMKRSVAPCLMTSAQPRTKLATPPVMKMAISVGTMIRSMKVKNIGSPFLLWLRLYPQRRHHVGRCRAPNLARAPFGNRLQFPPQHLAPENDAGVRAPEALFLAVGDAALPRLHGDVLHHRELGMVDVDEPAAPAPHILHQIHHLGRGAHLLRELRLLREETIRFRPGYLDVAGNEPEMRLVVDRREAEIDLLPAADAVEARERRHDDPGHVRHVMQRVPDLPAGPRAEAEHAPIGLLGADHRQVDGKLGVRAAGTVHEGDVYFVGRVLVALQPVAGHRLHVPAVDHAALRRLGKRRPRRRLAFAEGREDEAPVLPRRVAPRPHLARIVLILRRHLDALAAAVEFPAVVQAADGVAFHPSEVKLRAAMRTAVIEHLRSPRLAAIKRVVLAHDADRLGVAALEVLGAMHGEPELPHEAASRRAPPLLPGGALLGLHWAARHEHCKRPQQMYSPNERKGANSGCGGCDTPRADPGAVNIRSTR